MNLFEKHIELIEAVNNSKTIDERLHARERLSGFRSALDIMKIQQLVDCDNFYIGQGIDRPMCAGLFLDWQPTE